MEFALVALWLVAYYALALVGLPVASALFPHAPDRGATFALPIALGVVTVLTYWLGQLWFTTTTVAIAVVALAGLSVFLSRDRPLDLDGYTEAMAVFTLAFLLLVVVRAFDPAIRPGGGEKFLDFGLLKSLMRAPALPPEDMWWAGEPIRYYYAGHLLTAILTKLTATAPRYAYNLALAGFYGMLVTAAYGLAGTVAGDRGASRRVAGALAAFFVAFASNLLTVVRLVAAVLPAPMVEFIRTSLEMDPGTVALAPGEFFFWSASRVIPGTITEFPLFAYLNGDLHAHMMSQPFLLLVAALAYAVYRTPADDLRRRRLLVFGAIPAVVSLVAAINFWSFPTALGVVWLALAFAPAHPRSLVFGTDGAKGGSALRWELDRTAGALVPTVGVGALALVWSGPFVVNILLGAASTRSIGVLPDRTSLVGLLVTHGTFLAVFAVFLALHAKRSLSSERTVAIVVGLPLLVLVALLVELLWGVTVAVVIVVAPLLALAWTLLRVDPDLDFETVLFVAGAGLVVLVEFVFVHDNAVSGRFNTGFKVFMQVWVLWGTAAGITLARLLSGPALDWQVPSTSLSRQQMASVLAVGLVLATGVYGSFALTNHVETGDRYRPADPTLDGMAFVWTHHPGEAAAIQWLDDRQGRPHIVSAPGEPYAWGSPAASLTGLPTVVGWYQEGIYRGWDAYRERKGDVERIYAAGRWETRECLLDEYDVRYIYYGPRERERYGRTDFAQYPGVAAVERDFGDVTLYRVNQSAVNCPGN